jgi:tetratricopeptide (TPR) repeat protein
VHKHAYEEAVSLLEQIDTALVENKEEKLDMIRSAHARDLFMHGEYDTALSLFQELDAPAAKVIELYPSVISGKLSRYQDHLSSHDSLLTTLPASSPRKNDSSLELEPSTNDSRPDSETSTFSKTSTLFSNKSLSAWSHKHHIHQQKELAPLTDGHLQEAITYLIRFLTDKRQKLSKQLAASHVVPASTPNGINPAKSPSSLSSLSTSTSASSVMPAGLTHQELLDQATLVDTTLLKSYMQTNDALVGPLLRVQNHCDVKECETILMDKNKYKELVDLYNCKGLHSNALDLLSK